MRLIRPTLTAASFALALASSACARGEITAPDVAPVVGQTTVNASTSWAYVSLAAGAAIPQTDATTSLTWDIGFNATNVSLNGGTTGIAGVTAYCLCQNAAATNEQILAMTPANQLAAFDAVTAASIPAGTTGWSSDLFVTAKWYKYNILGDNRISPTFDVFLVQRGTTVYKVQIINYYGPANESRRITTRYAKLRD